MTPSLCLSHKKTSSSSIKQLNMSAWRGLTAGRPSHIAVFGTLRAELDLALSVEPAGTERFKVNRKAFVKKKKIRSVIYSSSFIVGRPTITFTEDKKKPGEHYNPLAYESTQAG